MGDRTDIAWRRNRNAKIARILRKLKESSPCKDCGQKYPYYVMDFDHVDGDKEFNISQFRQAKAGSADIAAEIRKCEIVCANCHRERTHQRKLAN